MTESKGSGQPRSAPLPAGILLSNYRIVKKLAGGGFSFVHLATDEHGTPVAVKKYLPSSLARRAPGELIPIVPEESANALRLGLRYFFEEGRSPVKTSHPAIARVFNSSQENGTVYMVMMCEQGKTLQEHILTARQQGKLKMLHERFIHQAFYNLMDGLCEIHIHKLLHLDTKPGNIYLREDSSPILLDSGAARQTLTTEASRFQPMYTSGFAAPEPYRKHNELGSWTDIYGIGAAIYVCIAGMPPQEAMQREKDDKLEEGLERLRKVYTASLISLVGWCLRMKPEERPQSVFRLRKALREESNASTELQALTTITQGGPVPEEKEALTTCFMSRLPRRRDS